MEFTWVLGFICYNWSWFFKSRDLQRNICVFSSAKKMCRRSKKMERCADSLSSIPYHFTVLIERKCSQKSWVRAWIPGIVVLAFQMELKIWLFLWEGDTEAILPGTSYQKWAENDLAHYITFEVSAQGTGNCLNFLVCALKKFGTLHLEHWVCFWKEFAMVY